MINTTDLSTVQQYESLSREQLLRMVHAALLLSIQQNVQTQAAVMAHLELIANKLPSGEKQKLANTEFDPEPIPAIQRKIEELQHELDEDLRNGIYSLGL